MFSMMFLAWNRAGSNLWINIRSQIFFWLGYCKERGGGDHESDEEGGESGGEGGCQTVFFSGSVAIKNYRSLSNLDKGLWRGVAELLGFYFLGNKKVSRFLKTNLWWPSLTVVPRGGCRKCLIQWVPVHIDFSCFHHVLWSSKDSF